VGGGEKLGGGIAKNPFLWGSSRRDARENGGWRSITTDPEGRLFSTFIIATREERNGWVKKTHKEIQTGEVNRGEKVGEKYDNRIKFTTELKKMLKWRGRKGTPTLVWMERSQAIQRKRGASGCGRGINRLHQKGGGRQTRHEKKIKEK